jgi:hypothetical protein
MPTEPDPCPSQIEKYPTICFGPRHIDPVSNVRYHFYVKFPTEGFSKAAALL